ncbi:MAG: FGGY-family carbohydrate kinase, partial [Clostridiales bacterium]|nr:FGGY-family carbohydrate kinase [Clostridiales bacterium]
MYLMGLDIGTSGCKATIIDMEGNIKGQAYKEYSLIAPRPGWEEIDPDMVWNSVKEVIVKSLSRCKDESIKAISVSSFGEAVIPIDIKGNVLYNSIIYIDIRGQEEAEYLKDGLGYEKILGITGASVHPMYSINKIMWMKQHIPEVYNNTWKFLLFADFILFKLGAKPHTDYSLAARTMAFDIINKKWSAEILEYAGVEDDKFGEPVQAGTVVGEISKSAAEELGLPQGLLLVAGGHDQPCAALGAGVIKNDMAVDGLGTTECITPAFDRPVISDAMARSSFACVPHVKKDMYVTYAFSFTSGSVLKWYRDNFGHVYKEEAAKSGVNIYDLLIEKAAKWPSKVFVLPHFAGAATPYMDTTAKGAIVGLNINTKAEDIIKAILEGITFEMMVNIEKLGDAGVRVDEMRVVGGLAKSELFLQLKADMMGRKVTTLNVSEAGTLGVAILAGTASGVYKNLEDAVDKLVKKRKEFYPDDKMHELYREKFETYKRI